MFDQNICKEAVYCFTLRAMREALESFFISFRFSDWMISFFPEMKIEKLALARNEAVAVSVAAIE